VFFQNVSYIYYIKKINLVLVFCKPHFLFCITEKTSLTARFFIKGSRAVLSYNPIDRQCINQGIFNENKRDKMNLMDVKFYFWQM